MKKIVLISFWWMVAHAGMTQSFSDEIKFSSYLMNKKYFDETIYSLHQLLPKYIGTTQRDSIQYYLGKSYYQLQQLDSSILHFDQVSSSQPSIKVEAEFFSAFNEAYLHRYALARQKLFRIQSVDSTLLFLRNFELASLSLLERKFKTFDSIRANTPTSPVFKKQEEKMIFFYTRLQARPKSPIKAALLSTVIPGAGKIYAGYKGQGIFNLIIAGMLGLQAWEGYEKDGANSFRFIAYTSLFTGFYVANIWGSALSVRIRQKEINNSIDDQILFDMHIPLRSAFR